jgi:hypothetical protein
MKCTECKHELIYMGITDGKDEYFCQSCKTFILKEKEEEIEFEDLEVDFDADED